MKKQVIFLLFLGFLFAQCSQKVTAPIVKETMVKEDFRSSAPAPGPARKIQMGTYNSFKLDNGLHVIVVENNKLPVVSYALSLKNEAFQEGDQAGAVSFAGQLLNKGITSKTKAEIDYAVDFIGASLNTSGSGMFGRSLTKHQDKLLELMSDILYNPTFPQEEFDKIKTQTLSGLATVKTDPNAMAGNVSQVLRYGADHPYGEIQTVETVNNITLDKCKEHYEKWFKPRNAYLTIVGDITPQDAERLANKYFGEWKDRVVKQETFEGVAAPSERKVAFVPKDGAVQSVIQVTYPVNLKPGSADAIKARVMNSILGGGIFSGRLMQNLREDKAFTYGARSSLSNDAIVGSFTANASVRNEVTDSSVVEFLYELNRMRDELVSQEDLDITKSSLAGSFARSLESPQTVANFARNIVRYDLPSDYYETYLEKLDAVTIQDVNEMAQKYITPDNAYIVVVGDRDNVAPTLEKFDADGKIDFYDGFGKELKDSDVVVPEGVTAQTVLMDYLAAIGGKDKVENVKSMKTVLGMNMMGQDIEIKVFQKQPGKFYMRVGNDQMVFSEQKTDGVKAMVGGMGQSQVITEGKELEDIKGQATIFSQLDYLGADYELDLKGVEEVDGENCYKIAIKEKDGKTTTEYYSMKSSLLLRQVTSQEGPAGPVTITNDFKEYTATDGILFPGIMTVTGMMPTPTDMKLKEVVVNPDLSDDIFMVE